MQKIKDLVAQVQKASPLPAYEELDKASQRHLTREAERLGAASPEEHYETLRVEAATSLAEDDEIRSIVESVRGR